MTENLYELSDRLFELRRKFADFGHEGVMLAGDDATLIAHELKELGVLSQRQTHEISRHRWNAEARAERAAEEKMLEELARPGTNVVHLVFRRDQEFGGAA
jgi:hypothetical protein